MRAGSASEFLGEGFHAVDSAAGVVRGGSHGVNGAAGVVREALIPGHLRKGDRDLRLIKALCFFFNFLPRSAAPRRNVQITCRGEASGSVSNTPPRQNRRGQHPDFRRNLTMFFWNFLKSLNLFFLSLQFHAGEIFKRGTCKELKHFRYHFSGGDEIFMRHPKI